MLHFLFTLNRQEAYQSRIHLQQTGGRCWWQQQVWGEGHPESATLLPRLQSTADLDGTIMLVDGTPLEMWYTQDF